MALDVKVKIELSKTTGSVGFGIPLLLECGVTGTPVEYVECAELADLVAVGVSEDSAIYKAANLVFIQANRPEKIAVCQSAGTVEEALPAVLSRGWRQLVLVNGSVDEYVAVADYIEATKGKMFFVSVTAEEWETLKEALASKSYDRTVILVNETENAVAALVGETAGRVAGSFTYKFKTLKNVAVDDLTDTEVSDLHENGAFGYVTKAGDDITTEGISQSGKYIDITDSIDFVVQNIEYRVQRLFNKSAKVSYDDRGIALLESEVCSALQDAFVNGIIATKEDGVTPDYSVSFAPRAQTTEADRATRQYKYGSFTFALAGAIHECTVTGVVTY